jgi:hypothetical protein
LSDYQCQSSVLLRYNNYGTGGMYLCGTNIKADQSAF